MKKIGYILSAHPEAQMPSTRISSLNIFPFLEENGYEPSILHHPSYADGTPRLDPQRIVKEAKDLGLDVVYFQKVTGPHAVKTVGALNEADITTIFGVCDRVYEDMTEACDATITVSDYLKEHTPKRLRDKVHVVHDGIEQPDKYKTDYDNKDGLLKCVVLSSKSVTSLDVFSDIPEFIKVNVIGRYRPPLGYKKRLRAEMQTLLKNRSLVYTLSFGKRLFNYIVRKSKGVQDIPNPHQITKTAWSIDTVYDLLPQHDVGIIPVKFPDTEKFDELKSKSPNRLTQLMAAGLPVVASPVPSYLEIVRHGENAFLAEDEADWREALHQLQDQETRERIGTTARDDVIEEFSQQNQAKKLAEIIDSCSKKSA